MTTDESVVKRKRGRPKKVVEPVIELPKVYIGHIYYIPGEETKGGERLVGQVQWAESTDTMTVIANAAYPSWRQLDERLQMGVYDIIDPSTGSSKTMSKASGAIEWFKNLDKSEFIMQYGDKYIIKDIFSEYETQ